MEDELNKLAQVKADDALAQIEGDQKAAGKVDDFLAGLETEEEREKAIMGTTSVVTQAILLDIEQKISNRYIERNQPGLTQTALRENAVRMFSADGDLVDVDEDRLTEEEREILGDGEKPIFESGIKVNFRDEKARWQGHVSLKVRRNSIAHATVSSICVMQIRLNFIWSCKTHNVYGSAIL